MNTSFKKKKICLVIPSLHAGGMERVMSELAIFFATEKNAEVHLILLGIDDKFYSLPQSVTIHEPAFVYNKKSPLVATAKTMLYLRKTINNIKPDAVLSFGEMYNSFVLIGMLFTKYRIFVSDRSKPDKNWGKLHHLLRNVFYKGAAGIIAQTEMAAQIMTSRLHHSNIKVIGNPINMVNGAKLVVKKNIILSVGRLIKSKRFDLLIKLFSQTSNENWELHILGDGPERHTIEAVVHSMNLSNKVTLLGAKKDVAPFYAQSKIFAFTSNSEGFPNVLGEAMSAGLAPVTFNFIAGASDLIEHGINGFLVPMDDENQYIKELNKLMNDNSLVDKFSAESKKSISKFNTNVIANEYYNFILS